MKIPQHKNHRRIVMLALRQIHTAHNQEVLIKLPPEFDAYEKIEVIILPVESDSSSPLSTKEFVKRFAGTIPDFPDLESPGQLQEREEWM